MSSLSLFSKDQELHQDSSFVTTPNQNLELSSSNCYWRVFWGGNWNLLFWKTLFLLYGLKIWTDKWRPVRLGRESHLPPPTLSLSPWQLQVSQQWLPHTHTHTPLLCAAHPEQLWASQQSPTIPPPRFLWLTGELGGECAGSPRAALGKSQRVGGGQSLLAHPELLQASQHRPPSHFCSGTIATQEPCCCQQHTPLGFQAAWLLPGPLGPAMAVQPRSPTGPCRGCAAQLLGWQCCQQQAPCGSKAAQPPLGPASTQATQLLLGPDKALGCAAGPCMAYLLQLPKVSVSSADGRRILFYIWEGFKPHPVFFKTLQIMIDRSQLRVYWWTKMVDVLKHKWNINKLLPRTGC